MWLGAYSKYWVYRSTIAGRIPAFTNLTVLVWGHKGQIHVSGKDCCLRKKVGLKSNCCGGRCFFTKDDKISVLCRKKWAKAEVRRIQEYLGKEAVVGWDTRNFDEHMGKSMRQRNDLHIQEIARKEVWLEPRKYKPKQLVKGCSRLPSIVIKVCFILWSRCWSQMVNENVKEFAVEWSSWERITWVVIWVCRVTLKLEIGRSTGVCSFLE